MPDDKAPCTVFPDAPTDSVVGINNATYGHLCGGKAFFLDTEAEFPALVGRYGDHPEEIEKNCFEVGAEGEITEGAVIGILGNYEAMIRMAEGDME